jgi:hypothetical protein
MEIKKELKLPQQKRTFSLQEIFFFGTTTLLLFLTKIQRAN